MDTVTATSPTAATASTPPAPGELWPGQGGRYICMLLPSHGMPLRALVVSDAEAPSLPYGPYLNVPGADSKMDGRANTDSLLASGQKHPAAKWAREYTADGHTDFYLPSQHDLLQALWHAPHIFSKDGWYWSSTQVSRYDAFVQVFENGNSYWGYKCYACRVRAFRAIPLEHLNP